MPTACPGRQRHKPSRQRLCRPQSHVAVGKEQSAKPGSAKADLPTATWHTVGKSFANCHASSRHSHVAPSALTAGFADCWFLGSRQRIIFSKIVCRLAASSAVGKERKYFFLKCSLPTAFGVAVGKGLTSLPTASHCSRQRLCPGVFCPALPTVNSRQSWNFFFAFVFYFLASKPCKITNYNPISPEAPVAPFISQFHHICRQHHHIYHNNAQHHIYLTYMSQ